MSPTISSGNVIYKRNGMIIASCNILKRNLSLASISICLKIMCRRKSLLFIYHISKPSLDPSIVSISHEMIIDLVCKGKRYPRSQICSLFHPQGFYTFTKLSNLKNFWIWKKTDSSSLFICLSYDFNRSCCYPSIKFDTMKVPIFMNFCNESSRKCIYYRSSHPMQSSRNLVSPFVKFTSCMQGSENGF